MVSASSVNFFYPQAQQDLIAAQRSAAIARALNEESQQPIQSYNNAPISPWQGIDKMAKALLGGIAQNRSDAITRQSGANQYNALAAAFGQPPMTPTAAASSNSDPSFAQKIGEFLGGGQPTPITPAAQESSQGIPSLTGDRKRDMMLYMLSPEQYLSGVTKQFEPTETARLAREAGVDASPYARAILNKQGTLELSPGAMAMGPNGTTYAPQNGIQMQPTPNGPVAGQVPGYADANAGISGAQKEAEQRATIFPNQTVNGMRNVPVTGAQIMEAASSGGRNMGNNPNSPATNDQAAVAEFDKMAADLGQAPLAAPKFGEDPALQAANEKGLQNQAEAIQTSFDNARTTAQQLASSAEARKLLDSGAFTGSFADWKLQGSKALKAAGVLPESFDGKAANTEAFRAVMGNQVVGLIKSVGGAQISNADREYAEKMAAGDIALDEKSIRKILQINDKWARKKIDQHNKQFDEAKRSGYRSFYDMKVTPPEDTTEVLTNLKSKYGLQ